MNLFIRKLTADSKGLIETYLAHELESAWLCPAKDHLWIVSVYLRRAEWKVCVWLDDARTQIFAFEKTYPEDGFVPVAALDDITAAYIRTRREGKAA